MAASIENVKLGTWVYILLFWMAATAFQGLAPAVQDYEYTFQRPIASPGTVQSQRWSFDFWVTVLYVTVWVVPITLAFAIEDTSGRVDDRGTIYFWRHFAHMAIVSILLLWYASVFIYGLTQWAKANSSASDNYHNQANDPRWCCVYYNLVDHAMDPSFPCVNTMPCSPGVSVDMLVTNPWFLYQLWFSFIFIIVFLVDLMLVLCLIGPAYKAHASGSKKRGPSAANSYVQRLV